MKSIITNNITFNVGNIVKYKYDNGGFFVILLIQICDNANMFRCLVLYDEAKHFREKPGTILRGNFNHFTPEKNKDYRMTDNLPFQVGKYYKIKRVSSGYKRTTLCLCLKITKIKRSYEPWQEFIFLTLDNEKKILLCYDWYFDPMQGLEWSYEEFNSF